MADLDQIWNQVKEFYEKTYFDPNDPHQRFRFKRRPSDIAIMSLYKSMMKHKYAMSIHYEEKPILLDRYLKWEDKKKGILRDDKK